MLSKIRQSTDNIIVKIILITVALSFVGFGGAVFLKGTTQQEDLISFSQVPGITVNTFLQAKDREIRLLQQQTNMHFSEEQLAELNIDKVVADKLIQQRMQNYLAQIYSISLSDQVAIDFIKKIPYFSDQQGNFSQNALKNFLYHTNQSQNQYIGLIKDTLASSVVLDTLITPYQPSQVAIENMQRYMAEERVINLFYTNLTTKAANYVEPEFTQAELQQFFTEHQDIFTLPERRSFSYLVIDQKFLEKKIEYTEQNLLQFYQQNQSDFAEQEYAKIQPQIKEAFTQQQMLELSAELAKDLENDLTTGLNLEELAAKYNLTIQQATEQSLAQLNNSDPTLAEIADSVFELLEEEISYPIEIPDKMELIIVKLDKVYPNHDQEFDEVKTKISQLLAEQALIKHNLTKLEKFSHALAKKSEKLSSKQLKHLAKKHGIKLSINKKLCRFELPNENKLPAQLIQQIFQAPSGQFTKVIANHDRAYFAAIKSIKVSEQKLTKIQENDQANFHQLMKEGLYGELMQYLQQENNMVVRNMPTSVE